MFKFSKYLICYNNQLSVIRSYSHTRLQESHRDILLHTKNYFAINKYIPLPLFQKCIDIGCKEGRLTAPEILFLFERCGHSLDAEEITRQKLSYNLWSYIKNGDLKINHFNAYITNAVENKIRFNESDFLEELKIRNIFPNANTYAKLVEYYCHYGELTKANKIIILMEKANFVVGEDIFHSLILGNALSGNVDHGCENVVNVMKEKGIKPNMKTYRQLLISYAEFNREEKFRSTLKNAVKNDIAISSEALLDSYVSFCLHKNKKLERITFNRIPENLSLHKLFRPIRRLLLHTKYDSAVCLSEKKLLQSSVLTNLLNNYVEKEPLFSKVCNESLPMKTDEFDLKSLEDNYFYRKINESRFPDELHTPRVSRLIRLPEEPSPLPLSGDLEGWMNLLQSAVNDLLTGKVDMVFHDEWFDRVMKYIFYVEESRNQNELCLSKQKYVDEFLINIWIKIPDKLFKIRIMNLVNEITWDEYRRDYTLNELLLIRSVFKIIHEKMNDISVPLDRIECIELICCTFDYNVKRIVRDCDIEEIEASKVFKEYLYDYSLLCNMFLLF